VIIDTSAIIAILNDEPERRAFNEAVEKSDICLLSTAGFVEASMVMEYSRGYEGLRDFDLWMAAAGIDHSPTLPPEYRSFRNSSPLNNSGKLTTSQSPTRGRLALTACFLRRVGYL
jgi:PIN domain